MSAAHLLLPFLLLQVAVYSQASSFQFVEGECSQLHILYDQSYPGSFFRDPIDKVADGLGLVNMITKNATEVSCVDGASLLFSHSRKEKETSWGGGGKGAPAADQYRTFAMGEMEIQQLSGNINLDFWIFAVYLWISAGRETTPIANALYANSARCQCFRSLFWINLV